MNHWQWLIGLGGLMAASPVLAYIGPGAGISFLGSFLSTLVVILLTIAAVLFWPLRYAWRRLRRVTRQTRSQPEPDVNRESK